MIMMMRMRMWESMRGVGRKETRKGRGGTRGRKKKMREDSIG